MKYYKSIWNDIVAEEDWGNSIWYLEIGKDGLPSRQVQIFENGPRLKYDLNHMQDKYGQLGDQKMNEDEGESWGIEILNSKFEKEWIIKTLNQG